MEWKNPPTGSRIWTEETLAELRAHPGRWALIRSWPHKSHGAYKIKRPPPDIETRWAYPQGTSELYARAVAR